MSSAAILEFVPAVETRKKMLPRGIQERDGKLYIRYTDGERHKRFERVPSISVGLKLLTVRKAQVLEGQKMPRKRKVVTVATLLDLAEQYYRETHRSKSADYENQQGFKSNLILINNLREWVGNVLVDDRFTCNVLDDKLTPISTERNWAASTWNHYRTTLSLSFRLGRKKGVLPPTAMFDLEQRKVSNGRVRWLNPDEFAKLRGVIEAKYPYYLPRFDLAVNTGLRRGSMLGLRWDMVDWLAVPQPVLRVPTTKNGDPVNIPLTAVALAVLAVMRERTGETGYIFERDSDLKYGSDQWFRKACAEAGIENFHWHDLRHHFASMLIQRGAAITDVQKLLGHRGLAMTLRYVHQNMSNLAAVVNLLDRTDTKTDTKPVDRKPSNQQVALN